jgi:flagellar basal-body rod protein FlgC
MYTDAASAIHVSMMRHDIGAHDVANINTPGYGQYRPHQAEKAPSGVKLASVARSAPATPPLSGTDLTTESVEQITNSRTLAFNAQAFKVEDEMKGTLLDMVG